MGIDKKKNKKEVEPDFFNPEVRKAINELKNVFAYKKNKMIYTEKTQAQASAALIKLCDLLDIFNKFYRDESRIIAEELTYYDSTTKKRVKLIDIDKNRFTSILDKNNMLTCLKSLALSNKIAHIFDAPILSRRDSIAELYNQYHSDMVLNPKQITFYPSFDTVFPSINTKHLYNIIFDENDSITALMRSIKDVQSDVQNAKQQKKEGILRRLNIPIDYHNVERTNSIIKRISLQKVVDSWIYMTYKEGQSLLKSKNSMFLVKNNYIAMTAQLLTSKLKGINYELIETPSSSLSSDFRNLLIIDDTDLSYYVEVHMPNYLAELLQVKCGIVKSPTRKTKHAKATGVYVKDEDEVNRLSKFISTMPSEKVERAEVITRESKTAEENKAESYEYEINELVTSSDLFEGFLSKLGNYDEIIKQNQSIIFNSEDTLGASLNAICRNYYDMYKSFSDEYKNQFIKYAINGLKNGDTFDRELIQNEFVRNLNDKVLLGKIFIYVNLLKYKYYQNIDNQNDISVFVNEILNSDFVKNDESGVAIHGQEL